MTQHDKQVLFKANSETVELAKDKLEHGEMSELLRETLNRVAHGADVAEETRLKDALEAIREDKRELRQERDNIERQLEEKSREEERIEQRLDALREQEGEYDGVLAMLEEDLHEGVRIMKGSDKVKRAAAIGDCKPQDVIADLKERNPDVPEKAYRKSRSDEPPKWNADQSGESLL